MVQELPFASLLVSARGKAVLANSGVVQVGLGLCGPDSTSPFILFLSQVDFKSPDPHPFAT